MTAEALALTPGLQEIGLTPSPQRLQIREIPNHLTRKALQLRSKQEGKLTETLWSERAMAVEQKVQDVINSQKDIIFDVVANSRVDADGPDLHVFFKEDFPIGDVWVEVKSSSITIGDYKDKIRNGLPEGKRNMDEVHKWMTEHKIILINGGESHNKEKTPEEILNDSFYPQLERIKENEKRKTR